MHSSTTSRRRHLFHQLFRSVPPSENLLQVYRCALQKDILIQGHMYISEHHVCFKANILGWVTRIVLPFSDIVAIEKHKTAKVIPNAIEIVSVWTTHVFASFMSRNYAYLLLTDLWQRHHRPPHLQNEENNDSNRAIATSSAVTMTTPPASQLILSVEIPQSNNRGGDRRSAGWTPRAPSSAVGDIEPGGICIMILAVVLVAIYVYTAYYLFRILRQLSFF